MSTTNNAQTIINQRASWLRQRAILQEQVQHSLIIAANGSFFTADAQTIGLVKTFIDQGLTEAVLLDNNNLPCKVDDLKQFLISLIEHHQQVLNLFHQDYAKLVRSRGRG